MSRDPVGAIVLHYKDWSLTERCLESLAASLHPGDVVVVVDNSWDAPGEALAVVSGFACHLVRPDEKNMGFARGMNCGGRVAERAGVAWLLFVNNDTVLELRTVDMLVDGFSVGECVGATGPVLWSLPQPGQVWSGGGEFSWWSPRPRFEMYRDIGKVASAPYEVGFISGCVIMVPAQDSNHGAIWPEEYLFGGEEWELSWRISRKGKRLLICPAAGMSHDAELEAGHGRSHSSHDPVFVFNSYSNRLLFLERNRAWPARLFQKVALLFYITCVAWVRWPADPGPLGRIKNIFFFVNLSRVLFLVRKPHTSFTFESLVEMAVRK